MRTRLFCAAILLFVLVAVVPVAHAANDTAKATMLIARVQVLSQQLSGAARDAAGGNTDAFANLKQIRNGIADHLMHLKQGDYAERASLKAYFADLDVAWAQLSADAAKVLDHQQQVMGSAATANEINTKMPVLNSRMDEVVKILTQRSGSATQVMLTSRQMLLADRMQRRIQAIVVGDEDSPSAAMGLQRDAAFYGVVLVGLIKGNPDLNIKAMNDANAREILKDINEKWTDLASSMTKLLDVAPDLQEVKEAADKTAIDSQAFLLKAESLMQRLNG